MRRITLFALMLLTPVVQAAERIVSVNGSLTEIVYALEAESRLVGVDTTSLYPPEVRELPGVGYQRSLSAEGILALTPDLVLATPDAGPPAVLEQLRGAGVRLAMIDAETSIAGVIAKVRAIARLLGLETHGERLIETIKRDATELAAWRDRHADRPRVLFLLDIGRGSDLAGGTDTGADAMIRLAGGVNVMADAFSGYKPLNAEAAMIAAPEVVLLANRNLETYGGIDGVLQRAGLAHTPAGRDRRVIAMDGLYLLGFGPRTARAALDLARQLHADGD